MLVAFPVLAFVFGSPWLLGGLILAGLPILIHLLHKRQFQETSWAAMRFLLAATRRNSRRLQLQQLLLLAVRTLAVVLLVLALARPFFETSLMPVGGAEPTHRIFVVDASCSMQRTNDNEQLFEVAQQSVQAMLESASDGDAFQVVRICSQSNRLVVAEPAWDRQAVIDEVAAMTPTFEFGDVANALQDTERLLATVPELKRREVCIISDFQVNNWQPVGAGAENIRESLAAISQLAELRLVNVGDDAAVSNVAVTSCRAMDNGPALAGQTLTIGGSLQRTGDIQQTNATLVVNDRQVASKAVTFSAAEESVTFDYVASEAGDYEFKIEVEDDQFRPDNNRRLATSVLEDINVLLVNGRQSGRPMGNASDYVRLSLQPFESNEAESPIRVRVITDGELMSVDASRYACVFLCNVGLFTQQEADFLLRYARQGGGVVLLAGDQVRADVWNRILYQDGQGILPVQLMGRVGTATDPQDAFVFDTQELTHPLVSDYRGNPGYGLENVLTFEYFKAKVPSRSAVDAVLSFDNGDPCIVASSVGNGRVVAIMTAGDDRRWSTWNTVGGTYAALINETVRFLCSPQRGRNVVVGQSLFVAMPSFDDAVVVSPDGAEATLVPSQTEDRAMFRDTMTPGTYRVQTSTDSSDRLFCVNVDGVESDLTHLTEDDLSQELLSGVDFTFDDDVRQASAATQVNGQSNTSLVRTLLWCVVALLLVEQVMAWRFSYGLALLLVLIALGLVRLWFF